MPPPVLVSLLSYQKLPRTHKCTSLARPSPSPTTPGPAPGRSQLLWATHTAHRKPHTSAHNCTSPSQFVLCCCRLLLCNLTFAVAKDDSNIISGDSPSTYTRQPAGKGHCLPQHAPCCCTLTHPTAAGTWTHARALPPLLLVVWVGARLSGRQHNTKLGQSATTQPKDTHGGCVPYAVQPGTLPP